MAPSHRIKRGNQTVHRSQTLILARIKPNEIFKLHDNPVKECLSLLSKSDQHKIITVVFFQFFLGCLDLIGVASIGILGALAVNGIQSKPPGDRVSRVLKILNLDGLSFQMQSATLALIAVFVLLGRTIFSVYFTRRTMLFLSYRGAQVSSQLIASLLSKGLLEVRKESSQETLFATTSGVNAVVLGVIGTLVTLVSDVSLMMIISIGLILVDFTIALSTLILFAGVGFALNQLLLKRAINLGRSNTGVTIKSNEKVLEVLDSYREAVVRGRRNFYATEIKELRFSSARSAAELQFLPNISKYVMESTVLFGALIICGIQFAIHDASHAVATLSVFMVAGTRIAPAMLRIQQGFIGIKSNLGAASHTLELIKRVGLSDPPLKSSSTFDERYLGFTSEINVRNLVFKYPGRTETSIQNINFNISPGETFAVVGPSGAGKTTLIDLCLGILQPDSGSVIISGLPPLRAIESWPGGIAYVPQDVKLASASIRENITLGFSLSTISERLIWAALIQAQMDDFVGSLPNGLETIVGDGGQQLSGGQRQRIGIARALLTSPKLLVLDEATSSLDGSTEFDISEAINNLKGEVTTILIAHRLSTIKNADKVAYMSDGKLLAVGTFDQVKKEIPDFDKQATIMGL